MAAAADIVVVAEELAQLFAVAVAVSIGQESAMARALVVVVEDSVGAAVAAAKVVHVETRRRSVLVSEEDRLDSEHCEAKNCLRRRSWQSSP